MKEIGTNLIGQHAADVIFSVLQIFLNYSRKYHLGFLKEKETDKSRGSIVSLDSYETLVSQIS